MLVGFWEIFPGIALQAAFPFFELGDLKDGAVGKFEVGPAQRERDGYAGACSRREGGYCGGSAFVAEIVEIDAIFASGLSHLRQVEGGLLLFHREHKVVGELLDCGPVVFGLDGDDYVEAFASSAFEEGFEV